MINIQIDSRFAVIKELKRQVPVIQTLAFLVANFQHLAIIPRQQPVRRLTDADYQILTELV